MKQHYVDVSREERQLLTRTVLVDTSGNPGGGDASATNQTSQITQETAINTVLGVKGDAKSAATDTTAISHTSILKQVSASIQAAAASVAGYLTTRGYGFDVVDGPTTTNGAYSAGDVIGGYRTVSLARANDEPVMITAVQVVFKAAVQPNIRVVLFGATPGSTLADNAAYSLSAADSLTVRRSLSSLVLGAAYTTHGTPKSISLVPPAPIVMSPISGGQTIGYYLIDDTGVTLTSTTDVQVRFAGLGA
jgi:hypothetical protein